MRYGLIPQSPLEKDALERAPHARVLLEPFLPALIARALMAFVRLGLAPALAERSRSPAELASELGLREEGVRHLLRVLTASGYVSMEREGTSPVAAAAQKARFALTPLSRATLLDGAPAQLDAWVLHNNVHWHVVSSLEHALAEDGVRDLHHHLQSADAWSVYQRAMLQTARPAVEAVAALMPEPTGRELLLDLGGSHGLYGAAICRRFAPMRCRVVDLPEALVHARSLGEQEGLSDTVEYEEGNILKNDLGTNVCDVVFMGNIIHHIPDDGLPRLLRKVYEALRPGGVVAIWDMAPPPDQPELDLVAEGFSMLFYLSSASECRTPDAYGSALVDAGFGHLEVQRGLSPTHVLITARR